MKLKQLFIYYLVIFAPLAILYVLAKSHNITANWFVFSMFVYVFPYRMTTDYFRLRSKKVIAKGEYNKVMNLFYTSRYARDLYFA
jgi:hypothetical protein